MARDVALEVASVMEKIAVVSNISPGTSIYIAEQRTSLEEARSCIERLLVEYGKLQLDQDAIQQEAYASTEFYEEELKKKNGYIQELELKAEQREEEFRKHQKEWQERVQMINSVSQKEKGELMTELFSIQDKLASLQSYSTQLAELQLELEEAKGQLAQQLEKEQQNLAELERKYLEQTNYLKREHERSVERIHNELEIEIEGRVRIKILQIVKDNEKLKEELQFHVGETNALQKDKDLLQSENAALSRDLELLRQVESIHLQRNTNQARLVTENCNKTLKRLVQEKAKELKKVRHMGRQLFRERGEAETFLIESIRYIMEQIKKERKLQNSQARIGQIHPAKNFSSLQGCKGVPSSNSHSPFVHPTNSSCQRYYNERIGTPVSRGSRSFGGKYTSEPIDAENQLNILDQLNEIPVKVTPKVDISELTWEDREKVLRYLFQKINTANQLPNAVPNAGYELLYRPD